MSFEEVPAREPLPWKNLMVGAEKEGKLAQQRGPSESKTVRDAADYAVAAAEVLAALRELREHGEIADVFRRLPDDLDAEPSTP